MEKGQGKLEKDRHWNLSQMREREWKESGEYGAEAWTVE